LKESYGEIFLAVHLKGSIGTMKSNYFLLKNPRFFLILLTFLVGCGFQDQSPTVMIRETEVIVKSQIITKTLQPTRTPTIEPSPTPLPTWTSIPTLNAQDAEDVIKDLVENNKGCLLPCWWGITPGETTWNEARDFLVSLRMKIIPLQKNVYGCTYDYLPDNISDGAVGATITIENDIVQSIITDVFYPLDELLFLYGQPDEVMLYANTQSIDQDAPLKIALYYKNKGFLAIYLGTTQKSEPRMICPDKLKGHLAWYLWDPSLDVTFRIAGFKTLLFSTPTKEHFYRLEEVTDLTTMEFYEKYRLVENGSSCFEMKIP